MSSNSFFCVLKELTKCDARVGREAVNSEGAHRVTTFCHTFQVYPLLPGVPEWDTDCELDFLDRRVGKKHPVNRRVFGKTADVVKSLGKLGELAESPGEGRKFVGSVGTEIEDVELNLEV